MGQRISAGGGARSPAVWLACALACASGAAQAARPMITDDARVVDAKACQLESWVRRNQGGSTEFWAQPACNVTGNLELTLGGSRTREDSATKTTAQLIQGKTLFKPLETNGWGMGLALGTLRDPTQGAGSSFYGYVPMSFSFADDRFVLHTNVGWTREQKSRDQTRRSHVTWGVGSEVQLAERVWLVAETFGQGSGKPFVHGGLRYWVVPERVQLDLTYGNRLSDGRERWISLGLRLLTPAFLP